MKYKIKFMKSKNYFFVIVFLILGYNIFAQFHNNLSEYFSKGNIEGLITFLNDNVEIIYNNSSQIFSKIQSENFFTRFFSRNIPSEFIVREDNNENFLIGDLFTSQGVFKVEIYYQKEKNIKINHIRFVKQE